MVKFIIAIVVSLYLGYFYGRYELVREFIADTGESLWEKLKKFINTKVLKK